MYLFECQFIKCESSNIVFSLKGICVKIAELYCCSQRSMLGWCRHEGGEGQLPGVPRLGDADPGPPDLCQLGPARHAQEAEAAPAALPHPVQLPPLLRAQVRHAAHARGQTCERCFMMFGMESAMEKTATTS